MTKEQQYQKNYRESHRDSNRQYHKEYRQRNKEKLREIGRDYYLKNRDIMLSKNKRRYSLNRDRILVKNLEWRRNNSQRSIATAKARYESKKELILKQTREYALAHPDIAKKSKRNWNHKNRDYFRKWRKRHPEVSRHRAHLRRAMMRSVPVNRSGISKWMAKVRVSPVVVCHWCQSPITGISAHFDHVIPISRNGPHEIGNLCISCPSCNWIKNDKLPTEWVCNGQLFLL